MKGLAPLKSLIWVMLLVFLPALSLIAQPPPPATPEWQFTFGGRVTEFNEKKQRDQPLEGCTVTLMKGGSQLQTINTDKNGKFKFRMDPNGDYTISVTKAGYITKRFSINTYNVTNERAQNPFSEFDVDIDLFKMYPGLDYSCLDKPIARIIYNPAPDVDDFDYDKIYTAQIQACIDNLKRLADEARRKQRLYDDAITRADKAFAGSDWAGAKAAYQEASGIIPTEQYPKDQIALCDQKLGAAAANAANDQKYKDLIRDADAKFVAKDWAGAKAVYQQASALKATEQYPKDQIAKCDSNAAADAASAANEQKYKDMLKDADAKFTASDWAGAKAVYQQASAMKPAEKYPKDQIALCDRNIAAAAAAAANEQKYKDLIKDADAKFAAKDWANAKTAYQQASALKATEQYPKDQIALCDKNAAADAATAATEQKYKDLLKDADAKFAAKDWANAKTAYQQASAVKPAEQYPKDQIALCDKNAASDAAAAAQAAKDKQYADLLKDADAKFAAKDWSGAKSVYTQASGIKPAEKYPKDQIALCDKNAAADASAAATDKKYNDLLKQADDKFAAKDWAGAKGFYTQASGVKPSEQYPKDQLALCDKNIADDKLAADKAAQEKKYADAIAAADAKFDAKDFVAAKAKYTEASGLKPAEQYPKDRIKACDDEIAKAGVDKQYADLVKQADTKFAAKDWAGAKALYEQASAVKSAEQYPKDKIKECDDKLAVAAKDKQYNDLVKQADTKFTAKDWAGAKAVYQQASEVKPEEQYPKDRMKACDDNIAKAGVDQQYNDLVKQADAKFGAKDWMGAKEIYQQASAVKPAEQYPKDKIKACDDAVAKEGVDKQYNTLIASADEKFKASDYAGAKDVYQQASSLKTAEVYPKTQIKACDDKMAGAAKDAQYADLIKQADEKFKASDWAGAKALYLQASAVKGTEQYPKDQAAKCDDELKKAKDKPYNDLIAQADDKFKTSDWAGAKSLYQQASVMKPAEVYPKDQMKVCDANIAKEGKDKKYTDLIAQADTKFGASDWAGAKAIYLQAAAVKAEEQYPKDQAAKCDANMTADKDKAYADLVKQADDKFAAKDWAGAKAVYQQASAMKATEAYPKDQIKICDSNIAKEGADKKYADLVAQADTKFGAADYAAAKALYQQASAVKAEEQYPKDRMKACDDELAKQGADKKYADLVKQADTKFNAKDYAGAKTLYQQASAAKENEQYPKDQVKACDDAMAAAGVDKQYNMLIAQADAKFTAKAWSAAKDLYQQASAVKPSEQYPKDRMKACDDNLASAADKAYNDKIAAADTKFKANDFAGAKVIYQEASTMRPNEAYPKDQVKACDDNIAKQGLDKQYSTVIAAADAKFNAKDYANAKAKYEEASALKPAEQYPKDRIKACDEAINASLSLEQKYKNAVAKGDSAFAATDYETAQSAFLEAKNLKPSEAYPPKKLAEINALLAAEQKDKSYRALIAKSDSLFAAKDYEAAKQSYTAATLQKPADQYPKDKLAEIKRIQDDVKFEEAKTARYNKMIADADKKFKAKDYKGAKAGYQQALQEKPLELYPKTQIAACDKALNPPVVTNNTPVKDTTKADVYTNDIAATHQQGITEETGTDAGAQIVTRYVVVGNQGWKYTKKVYSWGTFYFKDGQQISEGTFNYETSPARVQQQQAEWDKNHKK